ncbi:MAG: YfjI family protein [Planctomycetota bacterium]
MDCHISSVRDTLRCVAGAGQVVELRALKVRTQENDPFPRTVSGYFDDPEKLIQAASNIQGAQGIYFTLNPVKPALLARSTNRARPCSKGDMTTSDSDIVRRQFLFLDFDAVRPSGISATDDEKTAAMERANVVRTDLVARGWPEPILADSGNGAHLLFCVDLPSDDDGLLERATQAISVRYSDDTVNIDTSTANPARLIPLYGTLKAKGDHTEDRPHRLSRIVHAPDQLQVVPQDALESVAAGAPVRPGPTSGQGNDRGFDVETWIQKVGLAIKKGPSAWRGGRRWELAECPFNPEHNQGEAYLVELPNGAVAAGCHHASCTWGWPELRARYEPQHAGEGTDKTDKRAFVGFVSEGGGHSQNSWEEPIPLAGELLPVPPFDLDLLPSPLRPSVQDITERMQCPPDFPAVGTMIALAGVVGRKVSIRPKQHDDWEVVSNLWGAIVGRSGVLKTPAFQESTRPLHALEAEARRQFEEEQSRAEVRGAIRKEREKLAQAAARKAITTGGDPDEAYRAVIDEEDEAPIRRRLITNDCTVEKLGELLGENSNGVTIFRDELIGFLRGLDQEGRESSRAFFLESWNGTGSFIYDRIGRGTLDIEAAIVSILGGIQPGPLAAYLRSSTRNQGDDGFIQRFQLLVWPDVSPDWKNVDRPPNLKARMSAERVFRRLNSCDAEALGAVRDPDDPTRRPFLRFTPEAQERFNAWRKDLEHHLRSGKESPALESHLSKYRSLIPSLAHLNHLAEAPDGSVDTDSLERALGWGRYLISHARRVYACIESPEMAAAKELSKKILSRKLGPVIEVREVYRRNWSGLTSPGDVRKGLEVLEDHHWVRKLVEQTDGAPKTRYFVNPRILKSGGEGTDKNHKMAFFGFFSQGGAES